MASSDAVTNRLGGASSSLRSALVICPEAPYPLIGGGSLRTASLLEFLASRYALDLILFREPGSPDPREAIPKRLARELHCIELPLHSKSFAARAGRNIVRALRGRSPLSDRFSGFGDAIRGLVVNQQYDLAVLEHFWCAPYVEQVNSHAGQSVLDLHNVESALYGSYRMSERWPASLAFGRFAQASRRLEQEWLPRFTHVLVASEQDRQRVLDMVPQANVTVYPNSIPLTPLPSVPETNAVVFSGNLEYQPNISAMRWFKREIWPRIAAANPAAVLRVIGRNPQAAANLRGPRIEVSGPFENAVETLAGARVVVAPLLAGSGTRLKIIEAWAAGRAVVSTSLGAEGLPSHHGEHLLLADTAADFADAVLRLLGSSADRARLGAAGRALYESWLTWPKAWETLEPLWREPR